MKIPAWFVIGCGLLVLNLVLVLGGSISRHATAKPPDESQKSVEQQAAQQAEPQPLSDTPSAPNIGNQDIGNFAPVLPSEAKPNETLPSETMPMELLPTVPSLENATLNSPSLNSPTLGAPSIVSLEEVKNAVGELQTPTDLLAPLDAMMKNSAAPVSEQLSHSFFESMKLRLKTVKHLNQSAAGLVDEAAILYQRGEVAEAQKLLGVATQLRETTARLLVTHQ